MNNIDIKNVRNFCIIAHIDHGKSTLADRLIEHTGQISQRTMKNQVLDSMDLERERGITIKLAPITMHYTYQNICYTLNLIDTPGHVDFNNEVVRSIKACDGAILIIDVTQGIQAQTINNMNIAKENNLKILPVINKIDLATTQQNIKNIEEQIKSMLNIDNSFVVPKISAKNNINIDNVLRLIIEYLPSPQYKNTNELQALIFDSYYDNFKGVICFVRIFSGTIQPNMQITTCLKNKIHTVLEVGTFSPSLTKKNKLENGCVGYFIANIKNISYIIIGDTIKNVDSNIQPVIKHTTNIAHYVFSGFYPLDKNKYNNLNDALKKIQLSDASLSIEYDNSTTLGSGFRCGFLGVLHMDIIRARIEKEFNIQLIITTPSVTYKIYKKDNSIINLSNPSLFPKQTEIDHIEEPFVIANIYAPSSYIGAIMRLCQNKRGIYNDTKYINNDNVNIEYIIPLSEIIYDFFDLLKSQTNGYASLNYNFFCYQKSDLNKIDILLNGKLCDAFSTIIHKDKAYEYGRYITEKIKNNLKRQLFEVSIQACINNKIIARETIKPFRKDVIAKCYGGDITRKRKLLEKQKEGKAKMKTIGNVEIPSDTFIKILKGNN